MSRKNKNHTIDNQTKSELSKVFKPLFKGLVLFFDSHLLKKRLSWSAKLVYSGLYHSIPTAVRIDTIASKSTMIFNKSKKELIKELGISRSTFYEAIKELKKSGMLKSEINNNNHSIYYLMHQMDDVSDIQAMITTDVLKRAVVSTTKNDKKTYSPYAKIVLGLLAQESRKDKKRVIKITANEISDNFDIPLSTVYYLIKQFISNNTMSLEQKESAVFCLLLLTEYILYQVRQNEKNVKTYSNNRTPLVKNKIPEDKKELDMLDKIWNSL